ncbi:TetR/AcrR family transcriptional regulator [Radiobacillus sp. PE A8.2]|uniref:TetR/AcrR family transcriptional regulator n=1 Tax=Radiobacillus sp. PE A8.2 TaxID=3380349 RepID=UPI00388E151B
MTDKRTEIMKSAIKQFSIHGYFSTSVQQIAEDCGISKGSLYKYFTSKEDLLIQVFKFNHDQMIQNMQFIHLDQSLSPENKLRKTVVIELEGMIENKEFFHLLSTSLPLEKNMDFFHLMKQIRVEMINWHKEALMQAYGNKVIPIVWDLAIQFQAMLKGYLQLITQEGLYLKSELIADFVVFSLESVVASMENNQVNPVLTTEVMQEFEAAETIVEKKSIQEQCTDIAEQIRREVKSSQLPKQEKQAVVESIDLLHEELESNKPRAFLIQALLSFIGSKINVEKHISHLALLRDLEFGNKGDE